MNNIQYRSLQHKGMCRCCEKLIDKHSEKIIYFNYYGAGSSYIILCTDCIKKMNDIVMKNEKGEIKDGY